MRPVIALAVLGLLAVAPDAQARVSGSADALPPPTLLRPFDGSTVTDPTVVWSWFFQPTTSSGAPVVYDLHVAEVLPRQSPEEALRLNPLVINKTGLAASIWQTAQAVEGLRPGSIYAWQLLARAKVAGSSGASNVSEIRTFTYQGPSPESGKPTEVNFVPATSASRPEPAPGAEDEVARSQAGGSEAGPPASPGPPSPAASASSPGSSGSAERSLAAPPPGVSVHSSSRMHAESTYHQGSLPRGFLSQSPEQFGRMEIDPTLNLYGSPLSLSMLLTTEKNPRNSEINRGYLGLERTGGGLGLDIKQRIDQKIQEAEKTQLEARTDSLRQQMHDTTGVQRQIEDLAALRQIPPTETITELQRLHVVSPAEATLLKIPQFGFGSVVPEYNDFLLSGTTVNGGMVEYTRSRLYTALVVGKVPRRDAPVNLTLPATGTVNTPDLYRNLYAARLGYGPKEGSNVIASVLYASDDAQTRSILQLAGGGIGGVVPQQNTVVGVSARLARPAGGATLEGEINGSALDHSETPVNAGNRPPLRFLRGLFGSQRLHQDSAVDWSGALRGSLPVSVLAGRVTSGVRYVGPGYQSLGTTDLRKDVWRYDLAYDLESGHVVSLALRYAYDRIGVKVPELGASLVQTLSVNAEIHPLSLPALDVAFDRSRDVQRPDPNLPETADRSDQILVQTRHSARFGGVASETLVTVTRVLGTSVDSTGQHSSTNVGLGERLGLPIPVSILVHVGYTHTHTKVADGPEPVLWSGDLSLVHDLGRLLESSAGVSKNGSEYAHGRGIYFGAGLRLQKGVRAEVQWDYSDYRDQIFPVRSYTDRKWRLTLVMNQ